MRDLKKLSEKYAKSIKDAGFSHIKVELEADLQRNRKTVLVSECDNCTGVGVIDMTDKANNSYRVPCGSCAGTGGEKRTYNFNDTTFCQDFLKEQLPSELVDKFNYFYFYRDGSVDSELTFTLPIEYGHRVVDVINAWKKLAETNGNGMNTDGAGMHIAILPSGRYPTSHSHDTEKLNNFKTQVTKLLPSLILLGTASERTRRLGQYRSPAISTSKYNAIHIISGGFEYRLFDTCYDKPETFITYMGVIAKTLEFYKDPTKQVAEAGMQYAFHETQYKTESLVDDEDKISFIKKTIKHVKPDDFTIKELMAERGVSISLTDYRKKNSGRMKELTSMYREYKSTQETKVLAKATSYEENSLKYYRDNKMLQDLSDREILMLLRGMPSIEDRETWIGRNIKPKRGAHIANVRA